MILWCKDIKSFKVGNLKAKDWKLGNLYIFAPDTMSIPSGQKTSIWVGLKDLKKVFRQLLSLKRKLRMVFGTNVPSAKKHPRIKNSRRITSNA